jgi:hypothetical protein
VEASKRTGISRRTISRWLADPRRVEEASDAPTKATIAARFAEAADLALDSVVAGLRDERAKLGDRARALEVLSTRSALLSGGLTARTESYGETFADTLTTEEKVALRDAIDRELSIRSEITEGLGRDLTIGEHAEIRWAVDVAVERTISGFLADRGITRRPSTHLNGPEAVAARLGPLSVAEVRQLTDGRNGI